MERTMAFWSIHSDELYQCGEIQKILPNNRAELVTELKNPPVVYYYKLLPFQEGVNLMKQIRTLQREHRERVVAQEVELILSIDKLLK